jgi:site-specific recombinase XerD
MALHLLQAGVELNVVRSWLGHASIETTHAYVEIDLQAGSIVIYVEWRSRQRPWTAAELRALHITRRCT